MHIDSLAVAVINDHKTAHKHSFAPFQAYHNTKVFSFRGPGPLTMGSDPGRHWEHSPLL